MRVQPVDKWLMKLAVLRLRSRPLQPDIEANDVAVQ